MATATQADFSVPLGAWTELTATITGAVSTACMVQNITRVPVQVVFGGGSAPTSGTSGIRLGYLDSMSGTAAKIWVFASAPGAALSTTLT